MPDTLHWRERPPRHTRQEKPEAARMWMIPHRKPAAPPAPQLSAPSIIGFASTRGT
jgi:hypothetical protein